MNRSSVKRHMAGVTLVEALVTGAVLVVALLAVFHFQADMFTAGSSAKIRAEAIQVAQDKIAELRGNLTESSYDGIASGNDLVSGTTASFTRTWTVSDVTSPATGKQISVKVAWTDQSGSQQVQLDGVVTWDDPKLGAILLAQGIPGGGTIASPTGKAYYGDDNPDYSPIPDAATPNTNDDGTFDGTYTYYNNGLWQLIDSTGAVKLYSATEFASISGRVYIDVDNNDNPIAEVDSVFAGAPDVSVCTNTQVDADNNPFTVSYTDPDSGDTELLYFVNYRCYVGASWFGNVGMVVQADADARQEYNDDSCVGDPTAIDTGLSTSRHRQLGFIRVYRGYEEKIDGSGNPLTDIDGNRVYISQGLPAGARYQWDDFLMTVINGTETDADCQAPMEKVPGTFSAYSNPGDFVCLSASCPTPLPTDVGEAVYSISPYSVTADYSGGVLDSVITNNGDECDRTAGTDTSISGTFTCKAYDLGTGWSGYIEATAATGYTITNGITRSFVEIMGPTAASPAYLLQENMVDYTIAGDYSGGALDSVAPSDASTCTVTPGADTTSGTFSCTMNAGQVTGWTGTITGTAATGSEIVSNSTVSFDAITADVLDVHFDLQQSPKDFTLEGSYSGGSVASVSTTDGSCAVTATDATSGTYSCPVTGLTVSGWSGDVVATAGTDYQFDANGGTRTLTNANSAGTTIAVSPAFGLVEAQGTFTLTGSYEGGELASVGVDNNGYCDTPSGGSYTCYVTGGVQSGWSGTVTATVATDYQFAAGESGTRNLSAVIADAAVSPAFQLEEVPPYLVISGSASGNRSFYDIAVSDGGTCTPNYASQTYSCTVTSISDNADVYIGMAITSSGCMTASSVGTVYNQAVGGMAYVYISDVGLLSPGLNTLTIDVTLRNKNGVCPTPYF